MIILAGLPASGKSTLGRKLKSQANDLEVLILEADVLSRRMFGLEDLNLRWTPLSRPKSRKNKLHFGV